MKKIAIIGAAGFVGQKLVRKLKDSRYHIIALARQNSRLLLDENDVEFYELGKRITGVDVLINLAYPASSKPHEIRRHNDDIVHTMKTISNKNTRIIHISSIAVFGYNLDIKPEPVSLKMRCDYPYVESKIYIENLIQKEFKVNNIDIIRIGNVWGDGSAGWTFNLTNRILFGNAVLVNGVDGFSNVTDVNNIVSYINYLIEKTGDDNLKFHHLAEFNYIKWSIWIDKIEKYLGLKSVSLEFPPSYTDSKISELRDVLSMISPLKRAKDILETRYIGAKLRMLLRNLPDVVNYKLESKFNYRKISSKSLPSVFYTVMTCGREYENFINHNWKPEYTFEQSWDNARKWLDEIGYSC